MKKTLKERQCSYSKCDNMYTARNGWHKCCNWRCAIDYQKELEAKRARGYN